MSSEAWVFLGAALALAFLLAVALGGNADLAAENRRLRRALRKAQHPSARILPGETPLFDVTLAEIRALPTTDGAA